MMNTDEHGLKTRIYTDKGNYLRRLICLFLTVLFCLFQSLVWAELQITNAPASINNKETVTIQGSGFGTHADNSPSDASTLAAKFDDFEGGVHDAKIENGWSHNNDAIDYRQPRYTNLNPRTGSTLSSYHYFTDPIQGSWFGLGYGSTNPFGVSEWPEMYVSYYTRLNLTLVGDPVNYKQVRIEADDSYRPGLDFAVNYQPGQSDMECHFFAKLGTSSHTYNAGSYVNYVWSRKEFWYRMGDDPGQRFKFWEEGGVYQKNYTSPSDFPGSVGAQWGDYGYPTFLNLGFWIRYDSIGYAQMDDIYISRTQARVELGDKSTFSSCTHREIQIPKAWTDTSITITSNKGSFSDGTTVYLYVVDENGNVNSQGYPVKFGTSTTLEGDVNGDTKVDIKDLIMVAKDFGKTTGFTPACDVNSDSKVDIKDLILVAKNFGKST